MVVDGGICAEAGRQTPPLYRQGYEGASLPAARDTTGLDALQGKAFFPVFDCPNAYWQIEVDKGSSRFLAFSTPDGQYEWTRMPLGAAAAPATQQRMIDWLLGGMKWMCAIVLGRLLSMKHSLTTCAPESSGSQLAPEAAKEQLAQKGNDILGRSVNKRSQAGFFKDSSHR